MNITHDLIESSTKTQSHKFIRMLQLCLLLSLVVIVLLAKRAYASVTIARVDIAQKSDATGTYVELEWETATERDTVLFFIQRVAADQSFPQVYGDWNNYTYGSDVITVEYQNQAAQEISARGSVSSGAIYTVIDRSVDVDQTYKYRLVEVDVEAEMASLDDYIRIIEVSDPGQPPTIGTRHYYFPIVFNGSLE